MAFLCNFLHYHPSEISVLIFPITFVFSSVICFSLPLCLVLCLTILGIEEFFQQDAFNLREDMQHPELHTSIPKLQKLGKFPKIICQVKYLTWLSYLPLLKLESALQTLRRVFHLATAHKKHVLISLNITHSCKVHCGVKGNVQCSGHLVNHSGSSMRLAFTSLCCLGTTSTPHCHLLLSHAGIPHVPGTGPASICLYHNYTFYWIEKYSFLTFSKS